MKKQIVTAYGKTSLDVRQLPGANIFVSLEKAIFPTEKKKPGEKQQRAEIPAGAILLPHWSGSGFNAQRGYVVYANGLYEALRATTHIFFGYGTRGNKGELQTLETMSRQLIDIVSVLTAGKEAGSNRLTAVQTELAVMAEEMAAVLNQTKREARDKIDASKALEVSHPSGKMVQNLPANAVRLAAAQRRIERRQDEVRRIAARLVSWEQVLASEIGRTWDALNWFRKMIDSETKRLSGRWTDRERDVFLNRAGWAKAHLLPSIDAEPFVKTARLIRRDLGQAMSAAGEQEKDKVAVALNRILASLRFKDAQRAFEEKILLPFSVRQELGILTQNDMRHFRGCTENFRERLTVLSDQGFASPRKEEIIIRLKLAVIEIDRLGVDGAEIVKDALKRASHLL